MPDRTNATQEPNEREGALAFATAFTTEDWVDFALRGARGSLEPRRRRGLVLGLTCLVLILPFGALLGWLLGGVPPASLGDLFPLKPFHPSATPLLVCLCLFCAFVLGRYAFHDRLLRRRYRAWSRREHGVEPVPVRFRLDTAGIVATDADGETAQSWANVTGIEENDRQFFLVSASGGAAPIPKRDLLSAERDRLRSIALAHVREATPLIDLGVPTLPQDAIDDARVLVRYDQTVHDRAAASLLLWNTSARRRRRALLAFAVMFGLVLVLLGLDTFGWWLGWRDDARSVPFLTAFPAFVRLEARIFWPMMLYAAAFGLAMWLLWPRLLRRQALAMAHLKRDAPVHLAFGPTGVTCAAPGTVFRYAWSGVREVLEDREHIGLRLPLSVVLPVPKRALDAAGLAELRRLRASDLR